MKTTGFWMVVAMSLVVFDDGFGPNRPCFGA